MTCEGSELAANARDATSQLVGTFRGLVARRL